MTERRILITGGLGFIGINLVKSLVSKPYIGSLVILDRKSNKKVDLSLPRKLKSKVRIIRGSATTKSHVKDAMKGVQQIVHLAADTHAGQSVNKPRKVLYNNIFSTLNLLIEADLKKVERFIYISSSEVYGDKKNMPMNEQHPLNPVTPYGVSKLAAERLCLSFFYTKNLPVVVLRPFNIYGPHQATDKMIPLFITKLMRGDTITLNHVGKQVRDWVYIDDLVTAVDKVTTAPIDKVRGEVFNIGTGKKTSIKTVVSLILDELGLDKSLIELAGSSAPEVMENVGISEKAKRVLGWEAKIPIEEGIKRTVEWYKKNNV